MKNNQHPDMNRQLIRRDNSQQHLPSVDVREVVPEYDDEIDLRDLLDVLIRRKWTVVTVLLVSFFSAALYTFSVTPQFKATSSLKVSAQSANPTKFEGLESGALRTMEFQQTQVRMLQSEQLAQRVIDQLALANNQVFNPALAAKPGEAQASPLFDSLKSFIRPNETADSIDLLSEEVKQQVLENRMLQTFKSRFSVTPIRNSELIELSFTSPDPELSAAIINAAMDEFVNMHMDGSIRASQDAGRFLEQQIHNAQINLEKSEIALQAFGRQIGVVSLDPKTNPTFRQMEALNEALAKARADRIAKEARYVQNQGLGSGELAQFMENTLIQNLKNQHATLNAEYENLAITFKEDYPKMRQLKARMDDIEHRIVLEKINIFQSIKNDYDTALRTEQVLTERLEEQKQKALDLEELATQYKIYEREVETNKSIYQSLLQRSKEIEATVGTTLANIQIIDSARAPLYPFKPRVAMNLLLGIALGLMAGMGMAFVFEFFDNTIKNPDELADRFHIPVLGLIPFDKQVVDDRKTMAFKFYEDPRSPIAEAFRTTMTSVRLSVADNPPKTILITSILPGAGKSSLSVNAALSYLAEDEKCLIIDVDLRKPSLHKIFQDGDRGKGLSSLLTGQASLGDVVEPTRFPGLDCISSGPLPPNPAELLSSKRMRQLLELASTRYNRVILDGPPYQGFAEILVLANMVDGVILITTEEDTPREGVKHFRNSIANVGGRLLGAIVNKCGRKKGYGSYGGYKYYAYNYQYGQDRQG
ncbi:GumC family protein [Desulfobulbus alkaliphilus]|uniref:GumC family protein n=1 Tax=Desulfobulbus alkaliphilus TaxID=869814 RepID=UPI00196448AF|nr:polysaccharide biosynthesis tyrosine autokinase [Desulfobulbus alkaliphilus]MBM9537386.1 polysaccharide biosynthesis tyrosine autokinase [Desulfobulbus alkaliphilus]